MRTAVAVWMVVAAACWSANGDQIWFLNDEQPHTGEVLEETPHAFIVKFPKDQVEKVQRDKPLEIQQWRERRILWQDTGDYIVLSLPKERVASPDQPQSEPAAGLVQDLGSVGAQRTNLTGRATLGLTGRVIGKVIAHDEAVEGCKLLLVSAGGAAGFVAKLFGGNKPATDAPPHYEAETDREGKYAFEDVVVGEYDLYWQPPGQPQWLRRISEKPNVTVTAGETVQFPDIHLR